MRVVTKMFVAMVSELATVAHRVSGVGLKHNLAKKMTGIYDISHCQCSKSMIYVPSAATVMTPGKIAAHQRSTQTT